MELSDKEKFLLHYLRNRQIKCGIDESVKKSFGNYEQAINNLKQSGYLVADNHSYFLEILSTSDLKAMLKDLTLPVLGKKQELIDRIKENTTEDQREQICPDLYYVLTEKGINIAEQYKAAKKAKSTVLKENILTLIRCSDYKGAVFYMCEAYSMEIIPPGIGTDWSNKEQIWNNQEIMLNQIKEIDWHDLNNSEAFKYALIKCLYYDWLIEHELWRSIELFINETNELLNCDSLSEFFKQNEYEPSENQIWYTYLTTKRYNLYQANLRKTLKDQSYKCLPPGEFNINKSLIDLWKDYKEFDLLAAKSINDFPKTFETFQKHKTQNSDKYNIWILS